MIKFSGVIPGGYTGKNGLMLTVTFRGIKEGEGKISFLKDSQTLLNDGVGTKAVLSVTDLKILISSSPDSQFQIPDSIFQDTESPETFRPEIASDQNIFDGKWFLVFATQDKGSGIDHYEVCEGKEPCVAAESPYLLKNQKLDKKITVKAIDKKDNERTAVIYPKWFIRYELYILLCIIIAAIILFYYLWRRRSKRNA